VRSSRLICVISATIAGLLLFASPASAGVGASSVISAQHPHTGDTAYYDNSANILYACDHSQANGTARAILQVIDGNTKQVFDNDGAQGGCNSVGPLNVNNTKRAYLFICANATDSTCYRTVDSFPV
jgi:hypothetical protein